MSYIKIYFGDKPVFLCDEITEEINDYMHHPETVFIDEISPKAIHSLLHEINKPEFHAGILSDSDFLKLKSSFFKNFVIMKAAGGLVKNTRDEVLMIFRRGKWDLPKGKLEEGETIEECAVREVQEETGLQHIKLDKPIEITYHTYTQFGKHILKESHWYSMNATGDEKLVPQTEEEITDIRWANKEAVEKYILNSFPSIVSVLKKGFL